MSIWVAIHFNTTQILLSTPAVLPKTSYPFLSQQRMVSRSHNQSMSGREGHVGGREDLGSVLDPTRMGSGERDLGSQQICWVEQVVCWSGFLALHYSDWGQLVHLGSPLEMLTLQFRVGTQIFPADLVPVGPTTQPPSCMVWPLTPHTVQTQPRPPPSSVDLHHCAPSLHPRPSPLGLALIPSDGSGPSSMSGSNPSHGRRERRGSPSCGRAVTTLLLPSSRLDSAPTNMGRFAGA